MITNRNLTTNKDWHKMSTRRKWEQQIINNHQQDIENKDDRNKDDNSICQTI